MNFNRRLGIVRVQVLIPITEILIRSIGIQNTIAIMCKSDEFLGLDENDNLNSAKQILQQLMLGVQRTAWKGNCLSRSIVLQRLLSKNNISCKVCVGVRNKPKFKAHAWIEHKGIPLNAGKNVRKKYHVVEDFGSMREEQFT